MTPFKSNLNPSLGIEWEIQLLDAKTQYLVPKAIELLELVGQESCLLKAEIHENMVELVTPVTHSIQEVEASLVASLKMVQMYAKKLDLQLCCMGTHPVQHWKDHTFYPNERYEYLKEKFRWFAKRINIYGLHVHVGMPDGDSALRVANKICPYLPLLIALSSSSPFWQGVDTGMDSCRLGIIGAFPFAGMPKEFSSWNDYCQYLDLLKSSQVIRNFKDLYWNLRPNAEYGTLEFRICDGQPTVKETVRLTALIFCLSHHFLKDRETNHSNSLIDQYVLIENEWRCSRDGLDAMVIRSKTEPKSVRTWLHETIEMIKPTALELNCWDILKEFLEDSFENPAKRIRQDYQNTQSLEQVIKRRVDELSCYE